LWAVTSTSRIYRQLNRLVGSLRELLGRTNSKAKVPCAIQHTGKMAL
jgi:hypothetical protein